MLRPMYGETHIPILRKRIRDIEKKNIYLKKIEISNYYILINRDLEIMM